MLLSLAVDIHRVGKCLCIYITNSIPFPLAASTGKSYSRDNLINIIMAVDVPTNAHKLEPVMGATGKKWSTGKQTRRRKASQGGGRGEWSGQAEHGGRMSSRIQAPKVIRDGKT